MRTFIVLFLSLMTAAAARGAAGRAQKVDQIFAAFAKPGSPGCSVGVVRNGNFIYKKSFGYASLELGVPLTPDSVFYMGSVSKEFTAASIVLAAEQGYVSLDDDVHQYIPELPSYGHAITLREMLHQTSGLRDFFDLMSLAGRDPAGASSADDILRLIARQKGLNNPPGAEWIYSNSNYFLLGEVIQRATKKPLARFAAENIFQPLGMTHTLFYDDNNLVVPHRVPAYAPGTNGSFLVDWSTVYDLVGAGGLMSSIDDLLLWDRNFDSNKLGKGTLLNQLQSHGVLNNGNQINYAMGLILGDYRGLPIVEHGGALFGYRTEFLRFPKQQFSVILLCNLSTSHPEGLARQIADVYLQGELAPTGSALSPSAALPDPATFAGSYIDPRTKTIYKFTAEHGNLMAWGAVLRRIDANQFYDLGSDIITFTKQNGTLHASLRIPGELYFSGDKVKPLGLNEAKLTRFAGKFYSEELDTTYTLSVRGGHLTVKTRHNPPLPLHAATDAEFYSSDLGTIVFRSGTRQHVSGFKLSTQAARGIIFTRVN